MPEATVPIAGHSDALATVPDVILRLDRAAGVFHTHVFINGQWTAGADIPLPADSVVPIPDFLNRGVVAAGKHVGVRGDNSVHLVTVCAIGDSRGGPGRQIHRPSRPSRCNQD